MTEIVTKRLRLRKWADTPLYIADMVQWLNDQEVVCYSEQRHKHHTMETEIDYVLNGPDLLRTIHAGAAFIGTISAYVDRHNSVANVGIMIGDKSFWGQGYGLEAWAGFCDHLLTHGMRKIEAGNMEGNKAMHRVCRKYKMTFEGLRYGHFLFNSEAKDMLLWGKFAA